MCDLPANTGDAAGARLFGTAYSLGGPASFYEIDPATGVATLIGNIGFNRVSGIARHPVTGVIYGTAARPSDNVAVLITINPATGVGTEVAPLNGGLPHSFGSAYTDISFRGSDNALYAYLDVADGLGIIDIQEILPNWDVHFSPSCCGNGISFSGSHYHFTNGPWYTRSGHRSCISCGQYRL
jgi:hypothetical protein